MAFFLSCLWNLGSILHEQWNERWASLFSEINRVNFRPFDHPLGLSLAHLHLGITNAYQSPFDVEHTVHISILQRFLYRRWCE